MMAKKKPTPAEEAVSFEQSLQDLEQIVAKLESGKLPLADSLAAYEQGVSRLNGCYGMLTAAERRIALVKSVAADGSVAAAPFEESGDADLTEKSAARSRRRTAGNGSDPPRRMDDDASLF